MAQFNSAEEIILPEEYTRESNGITGSVAVRIRKGFRHFMIPLKICFSTIPLYY